MHNIHIYMNHFFETTESLYFLRKEVKEKTTCVNLMCNYSDLYVRTSYGPMKMKRVNEMKRKINRHTVSRCKSEDKNRDRFFVKFFFYQRLVSVT